MLYWKLAVQATPVEDFFHSTDPTEAGPPLNVSTSPPDALQGKQPFLAPHTGLRGTRKSDMKKHVQQKWCGGGTLRLYVKNMSYIVELWIGYVWLLFVCLKTHCDENIEVPWSISTLISRHLHPWLQLRHFVCGHSLWDGAHGGCWCGRTSCPSMDSTCDVGCLAYHLGLRGSMVSALSNVVMSVGCLCIISIPCQNGMNTLLDTSTIHSEYTHAVCVFCLWISVCFCETAVHSANLPMHLWRIIHVKTYVYIYMCMCICVYLVKYT